MTSFYMTSLHFGLNKAAKSVDIIPLTLLASFAPSSTRTKYKVAAIFGLTYKDSFNQFMKVGGTKTWKELTIRVSSW